MSRGAPASRLTLDGGAVSAFVARVQPDAIIHQATALSGLTNDLRAFDRLFATTNRLRVEGTRSLIAAADRIAASPRLIVQSFCGWPWAPIGGSVKAESDPLDPEPAPALRRTIAAITELEDMIIEHPAGVALRYGALYGPGTSLTNGGAQIEAIRSRRFPVVGGPGLVHLTTTARGSSNTRARAELGWVPGHPHWREGFAADLRQARAGVEV